MKKTIIAAMTLGLVLGSCSQQKGWGVDGKLNGASSDTKIALEGYNAGIWYGIDSLAVSPDGSFTYRSETGSPYPDVYRLSLGGKSIYFPIDSLETVTVTANAADFDKDYTLAGSQMAEKMMQVDTRIASAVAATGAQAALTDSLLKRDLNQIVLDDSTGVISYYIINKTLAGQPLYSPASRKDVAMLGALAQKFASAFPADPRTKYLETRFLQMRSAVTGALPRRVMEANEVSIFDIALYDAKGNERKLTDLTSTPGATILSFTAYGLDNSVAYNVELNRIFEKYRPQGLKIYQVAFDADEVAWRQAAANLPWVAVRNNPNDGDLLLRTYNVGALPMTYIIDGQGNLVERVVDPTKIESSLQKHL